MKTWMMKKWIGWTIEPIYLPSNCHHLPKHPEKLFRKYDPYKKAKVEDHIDDFYLHLRMLEVCYDYFSCRLFPSTLEGRA